VSRYFNLTRPTQDIALLTLDAPDDPLNTLKPELASELELVLDELQADDQLTGLVFASAKPNSFIAGANIDTLMLVTTSHEGQALAQLSQHIAERIASLPMITVCIIHGSCLGGGLEIALAFDIRIASDHEATRLGLPEVQLGLIPGGGGTQRLVPLVGVEAALDMMLSGRRLTAVKALEVGLIDRLADPQQQADVAIGLIREQAGMGPVMRPVLSRSIDQFWTMRGFRQWLLVGNFLGRALVFSKAKARIAAKTHGHYPAPEALLEVVERGLAKGPSIGFAAEAKAFGQLCIDPVARQLIGIFRATTAMKKDTGICDERVIPKSMKRIGVIGAGLMGAGITAASLEQSGVEVILVDQDPDALERARSHVEARISTRVARGIVNSTQQQQMLAGLTTSQELSDLGGVDLVIEAVFENLELKQSLLKKYHAIDEGIFASNTSSLSITSIAKSTARPEQVLGMHYFSPVEKMPLLEIITTPNTSAQAIANCVAFGKRQNKTVIVVADSPGFYTSRVLAPYLNEAAWMLEEGLAIETVDQALVSFGFPVGPFALLDEIGMDVAAKVGDILRDAFPGRFLLPKVMSGLKQGQRQGRKNFRGFYLYNETSATRDKARPVDTTVYKDLGLTPPDAAAKQIDRQQIAERCVLQMVNEAVYCLQEKILRNPRDGDIGAVFGLGFPPFLGGPFRYIDALGADAVLAQLKRYEAVFGDRFRPAPLLIEKVHQGTVFHPPN